MNSVLTKEKKEYIIKNDEPLIKYELNDYDNINVHVDAFKSGSMILYNTQDKPLSLNMNIELLEGATFKLYNITTSTKDANITIACDMPYKNSNFESLNVVLSGKDAKYKSSITINHLAPLTSSELSVYAIAKDNANVVLDNNAYIKKAASKSVAHQKAKGLTLNKTSLIKALPNLYIDEYDVIANHAASIGSLNPEDLFYLMSRGLTKEEASKIIIMGFIMPLIDKISDEETKKMILNKFLEQVI